MLADDGCAAVFEVAVQVDVLSVQCFLVSNRRVCAERANTRSMRVYASVHAGRAYDIQMLGA